MNASMTVRTRFAPSPTGYLHIGGVRTALFNWLFARHHQGQFILRVDDTDRERHVEAALRPILDGFRWLGLDWDEGPDVGGPCGPYFQSERHEQYQHAISTLLSQGAAYRDFATPEEIQTEREQAQREKRRFIYSRRWMAETDEHVERLRAQGRSSVVRLKMPRDGRCEFDDLVRGSVAVDWALEQDHVVQRADGSFLYHLASTVDDYAFRISHVIRAVEHLSNTPRQIFIARELGYDLPQYAHLPYVAAPGSGEKLSKRKLATYFKQQEFKEIYEHGVTVMRRLGVTVSSDIFNPVGVDFYRDTGYLSEALINYLLLLGWSLDDRTETFSRDEMIRHFSLARVNKSPASFDPKKLLAFQERQMQSLTTAETTAMVLPFLGQVGLVSVPPTDAESQRTAAVVAAAAGRLKVAGDILNYPEFFTGDDTLSYDLKAFDKRLRVDGAADCLLRFRIELATAEPFDAQTLDGLLRRFVERQGISVSQIIHALRVAVTGKTVGFGLFEGLAILGRHACLNRIDRALAMIETLPRSVA
jgi:glutamyl-tRNA synthetase